MPEDELLAGRVAIVTGAASGLGRVMARALAGAGAKIAVFAESQSPITTKIQWIDRGSHLDRRLRPQIDPQSRRC